MYNNFMQPTNQPHHQPVDITKGHSRLDRIKLAVVSFAKKRPPKQRLAIVTGVSVGVLVFGIGALQMFGPEAPEPPELPEIVSNYTPPPVEPTTKPSKLTGVQVTPELSERPITGIMIENSIDARPQAGLVDAGVVFEAIAEGGITRFLALFQEAQPDHIGPIRSARPYYVRWAAGFDAGYTHSGGSPEALALIGALGVKDLDHGRYAGSFDRVSNRYAPHNVYTSMARLDSLRSSLGFPASTNFTGFDRMAPAPEEDTADDTATPEAAPTALENANSISFDISSHNYNTSYTYNAESNTYARVMAGKPHVDERSGKQIQPSVVVALTMPYSIHPNRIHSVYGNIGSGEAIVFQNGNVIKGAWNKPSDKAELTLTTPSGPLLLQPGQTWFTAIPSGRVSYTP